MKDKKLAINVDGLDRLQRYVLRDIQKQGATYDGGVEGYLRDIMNDGRHSEYVSVFIYPEDIISFYKKFRDEIYTILFGLLDNTGCSPKRFFLHEWDASDPSVQGIPNQSMLARFGYEVTALELADMAGIEI